MGKIYRITRGLSLGKTLDEIQRYLNNLSGRISILGSTTFGETSVAKNTQVVSGSAVYNLIPANFREFTSGTGTTGAVDRKFRCTTGTGVGGYGAIQSFRAIPSKDGVANMARFTGYFESNVSNSWQGIGLISIGDELSFGYNGTDFGIWHRYGGLAEVRTITITGAAGGSENLTLTLNGTAYTIPLTTGTVQHNAYEIAAWLNSNQSVWVADQLDDDVIIAAQSDGAKSGSYSFSSSTATGSIAQNKAGVTKTSDHIPQSSWNGTSVSSFDPSKGNVYQICYQNMGVGEVRFYIENPSTSDFVEVHVLRTANNGTEQALGNPSMRLGMYCVSLGSTTDLAVYAYSMAGFVQGELGRTRNPRAYQSVQSITTTDETAILTLRNRRTYNGFYNQVEIQPLKVSVSNETSRSATVRVRASQNVGIEQNFQTVGTNLVGDVDETAINYTSGRILATTALGPTGKVDIDLDEIRVQMPPTLSLVVTVERSATGGANTNFTGTITWYEDV